MDKRKLSQESSPPSGVEGSRNRSSNTSGTVTLEALYQLAASYFTDRESTLRRLHHLQIASTAIRVCANQANASGACREMKRQAATAVRLRFAAAAAAASGFHHTPEFKDQNSKIQKYAALRWAGSFFLGSAKV